jgi:hypothetical protein
MPIEERIRRIAQEIGIGVEQLLELSFMEAARMLAVVRQCRDSERIALGVLERARLKRIVL